MKKSFLTMATLAMALVSCSEPAKPLTIDNALTPAEVTAARLTPEVLWKMRRIGSAEISADGTTVLYTVTDYSMAENRGVSRIYTLNTATGETVELTDTSSSNNSAVWGGDGRIYLLSNRSGAMQVWSMDSLGKDLKQIT
ncbi:MAG: peptidase S9, partial [Alistipes sp.]|nr:peptidase S9 [Alistipes sp.]